MIGGRLLAGRLDVAQHAANRVGGLEQRGGHVGTQQQFSRAKFAEQIFRGVSEPLEPAETKKTARALDRVQRAENGGNCVAIAGRFFQQHKTAVERVEILRALDQKFTREFIDLDGGRFASRVRRGHRRHRRWRGRDDLRGRSGRRRRGFYRGRDDHRHRGRRRERRRRRALRRSFSRSQFAQRADEFGVVALALGVVFLKVAQPRADAVHAVEQRFKNFRRKRQPAVADAAEQIFARVREGFEPFETEKAAAAFERVNDAKNGRQNLAILGRLFEADEVLIELVEVLVGLQQKLTDDVAKRVHG